MHSMAPMEIHLERGALYMTLRIGGYYEYISYRIDRSGCLICCLRFVWTLAGKQMGH